MGKRIYTRRPLAERFWEKVAIAGLDDCWEWQASIRAFGYGEIRDERARPAHRVAWELAHGPIPEGLCVCHRCDNPPCVNPAHLFLGTRADNNADMRAKGRASGNPQRGDEHWSRKQPWRTTRGERHGQARLTAADVLAIRDTYPAENQYQLAERYGVSQAQIYRIVNRLSWRDLEAVRGEP